MSETSAEQRARKTNGHSGYPEEKFSVSLTGDALIKINMLADTLGVSRTAAVKHAISVLTYVIEQRAQGAEILVQPKGGERRLLEFVFAS